jgi:predicted DNA-binding transcriptional regulator YafY
MKKRKNLNSQIHKVQEFIEQKPRTQKEIADFFGVDRQTVRRAIDNLSCYAPLIDEKDGRNIVYRIEKTKPLEFTPLELATLILAQEAIISTGQKSIGSPFAESAKSLIEKVRKRITPNLRERLDSLSEVFGSSVIPAKNFSEHFTTIEILVKAATERQNVQILYQNLSEKHPKSRKVSPYNVYFDPDGATLKLIGFDELRQKIIAFSIDHIKKIELLKENFERPKDYNLQEYLEKFCFNGIHGNPLTVRLKVFGVTANIFTERKFHPSQKIIQRKDSEKSLTIEMTVAEGRGLERFILSWMPDIDVISPNKLREKIKENLLNSLDKNK